MSVVKNNPAWYGPFVKDFVERIYDERFWREINPVEVHAVGDLFTVLVKDDMGNWQLKAVSVDPSKVIKASQAAVTAAAQVLLSAGEP